MNHKELLGTTEYCEVTARGQVSRTSQTNVCQAADGKISVPESRFLESRTVTTSGQAPGDLDAPIVLLFSHTRMSGWPRARRGAGVRRAPAGRAGR
ncbi:MAG TPA: hypothetical protein VF221_20225 [Chloroflexota bacterium]